MANGVGHEPSFGIERVESKFGLHVRFSLFGVDFVGVPVEAVCGELMAARIVRIAVGAATNKAILAG